MLFPILRPGASEIVYITLLSENELGRTAVGPVDDCALAAALDELVTGVRAERLTLVPLRHHLQRLRKRFGVVERLFHQQSVAIGLEYLDHFVRVAELEHRMRGGPSLDVGR